MGSGNKPHPVFSVDALRGELRFPSGEWYRQVIQSHLELHDRYDGQTDRLFQVADANSELQEYISTQGGDVPNELLRLIAGVDHVLHGSIEEHRPSRLCGCGDALDGTSEGTHCGNCHAADAAGLELERDRLLEERKQLVERGLDFTRRMNQVIASCEELRRSHERMRTELDARREQVRRLRSELGERDRRIEEDR